MKLSTLIKQDLDNPDGFWKKGLNMKDKPLKHLLNCPKFEGKRCDCEYLTQILVCDYLDILKTQGKVEKYTAVNPRPNMEHMGQRMKAKRAGLHAGFPDLIIVTKTKAFCIEMKIYPNKPDYRQKDWAITLSNVGINCYLAYSYEEAKEIIDKYI